MGLCMIDKTDCTGIPCMYSKGISKEECSHYKATDGAPAVGSDELPCSVTRAYRIGVADVAREINLWLGLHNGSVFTSAALEEQIAAVIVNLTE